MSTSINVQTQQIGRLVSTVIIDAYATGSVIPFPPSITLFRRKRSVKILILQNTLQSSEKPYKMSTQAMQENQLLELLLQLKVGICV